MAPWPAPRHPLARYGFPFVVAVALTVFGCRSTETSSPPATATAQTVVQAPSAKAPLADTPWGGSVTTAKICPEGQTYGAPLASDAKPTLVRDGFVFVEGPVWVEALGALLFSEMDFGVDRSKRGPPSTIHRLVPPSTFSIFLADSGSNGLALDDRGLVACTHDTQAVSRIDLGSRTRTIEVGSVAGKRFNSPNDVALGRGGQLYFTDPDWQIGARTKETGVTGVYWAPAGGTPALVDGGLDKPNGIALSPDQRSLYVGARDGSVSRYALDEAGKPGARESFAKVASPDGMAVDCAGNLYVTSHDAGQLVVLSPAGQAIGTVAVGPRATNAAFGGADRKTLYITAGSALYALPVAVPGYPY